MPQPSAIPESDATGLRVHLPQISKMKIAAMKMCSGDLLMINLFNAEIKLISTHEIPRSEKD